MRRSSAVNVVPDGSTAADRTVYPYPTRAGVLPPPPPDAPTSDGCDSSTRSLETGRGDGSGGGHGGLCYSPCLVGGNQKKRMKKVMKIRERERESGMAVSRFFIRSPTTADSTHLQLPPFASPTTRSSEGEKRRLQEIKVFFWGKLGAPQEWKIHLFW
ncbi:uncharacterized protein J3R85_017821 [Psidium guajava]|nr:uncharacterized protein J3R85_017821 [Psidium guajava]